MKYIVLVSHGNFAYGLHSALRMLDGGEREDIISMGLEPDMGSEVFTKEFTERIASITPDDEILLFGDIGGGSPLTMSANVLAQRGLLKNATVFGGSNLPLVLNALFQKDDMSTPELINVIMESGKDELKLMEFSSDDTDDEI